MDATAQPGIYYFKMKSKNILIFILISFTLINFSSAASYGSGPYGSGAYGIGYTPTTGIFGTGGGGSSCSYNWICSEWYPSPCPSDGIQKRVCVNKGTCRGELTIPSLQQKCTPGEFLSSEPLFDVFVNIFPEYKWIIHQNETRFNVELINKGNDTTIDISIQYWITHKDGRFIAEKQETRAIGKNDKFQVTIPFEESELGTYQIYVQITYGDNRIAIAKDSFQIVRSDFEIFLREAFSFPYILIPIGLIMFFLLATVLSKIAKRKPRKSSKNFRIEYSR